MKGNKYCLGLVSVSFRQHLPIEILEVTKKQGSPALNGAVMYMHLARISDSYAK